MDFIDYGVLNGVYHSKTPMNPPNAWIQLNNTSTLNNALAQHEVVIERVRMDEGAYNGIFVNINPAQCDRLAHLKISGLRVNGTGLGGNGVWVQNAQRVTIERSWFGYAGFSGTAVALINVDSSTLRDVRAEAAFNRIHANAGCRVLTLIDTTYGALDSLATTTNIIRDGKYGVGKDPTEAVDVVGNIRATEQVTANQVAANQVTANQVSAGQLTSTAPQGTTPLAVTSTTVVPNLNADKVDGKDASAFAAADHTHAVSVTPIVDASDKLRVRRDPNLFGRKNFALELGRGQAIAFAGANSSAGGNYGGVLGQIGAFNAYYFSGDLLGARMEFYNQSAAEWFKTGIKFYTSLDSAATATERLRIEPNGNVHVFGSLTKGSGTFLIDHPLYPTEKQLYHGFVEAPRYDLIYRGRVRLVKGRAVVSVDKDSNMSEGTFAALTQNPQIFVQNETGWEPVRAVLEGGELKITARSRRSRDTVGWLIVAERKDAFIKTVNNVDAQGRLIPEHKKQ